MLTNPITDIPLQTLDSAEFNQKQVCVSVLRLDQTDPLISGNKWFKLKYNLAQAKQGGFNTLLSFGGAYSNHLHALAAAGKKFNLKTIGVIRGEEHLPLNPTLSDARNMGMALYYINRKQYRRKQEPAFINSLLQRLQTQAYLSEQDSVYLVPEGGTNALALQGASEICSYIPADIDYIGVACGTGGTMAGIITGLNNNQYKPLYNHTNVIGFPALKGARFLQQDIQNLLKSYSPSAANNQKNHSKQWRLVYDYHFGGFGRMTPELARFIIDFEDKYSIPLDPVYTAKMMYGIVDLINNNYFPPYSQILVIHSGGLQGRRGMDAQIKQALAKKD